MLKPMPANSPIPTAPAQSGAPSAPGLAEHGLDRPLGQLTQRPPVSCPPGTALRTVLETMRREQIGSIVVVDASHRPLGVFTLGDLLARVALPQTPLDTPIGNVMSKRVFTLPAHAPAFQAALLMARENIRHVPLVQDGRLVGVVSESRLFALWRHSIGAVRAAIAGARDIDALVAAARGIRDLPARLLREGLTADAVTALLTSLNDLLVERLLDLTGAAATLGPMQGCWLALGSQGRCEQTLATDQDNAIVFDDEGDPEQRRRILLPLALEVNRVLDRCGFGLCRGDIMASNPNWCLSLAEWKSRFAAWIDRPDQQALLNAAIFFDFRSIAGAHPVVGELRSWLAAYAQGNDRFLLLMVLNAQNNQPPLGVLRDFVLLRRGDHPHTLDLKTNGVQPFVEAARIYALSCGVEATQTAERIEAAGRARGIPEQETAAWRDAFHAIQRLRLSLNTSQLAQGGAGHNFLDPDTLNVLDRNVLKEALRQARSLQNRLARDFSLGGTNVRA
ncbi:CBS signal-transduction protein (fragment) [Burkholderiales bacterium]